MVSIKNITVEKKITVTFKETWDYGLIWLIRAICGMSHALPTKMILPSWELFLFLSFILLSEIIKMSRIKHASLCISKIMHVVFYFKISTLSLGFFPFFQPKEGCIWTGWWKNWGLLKVSEKYDEKAIKTEDIELCSYFQNCFTYFRLLILLSQLLIQYLFFICLRYCTFTKIV